MPLTFGFKEERIIKRRLVSKRQKEKNKTIISSLVEDIKNHNDWLIITNAMLKEKYDIKDGMRIVYIMHSIKNDPHIISKNEKILINNNDSSTSSSNNTGALPFAYKYVTVEEKRSLLFNSIKYRKLNDDDISILNAAYNNIVDDNVNNILCCYSYLKGVNADKNWTEVSLMTLLNRKMIDIDDALNALNSLYEHKICAYKLFDNKTYFHLTTPDKFETINNETIQLEDNTLLSEKQINSTNKNIQKIDVIEDKSTSLIDNQKEVNSNIDLNEKLLLIKRNIDNFFDDYREHVKSITEKESEEANKSYAVLVKLQEENKRLSDKITNLQKDYVSQQKRLKDMSDYNYELMKNTFSLLETLIGQSISLIEDFSRNPRYVFSDPNNVNKFKSSMIQTVINTVNDIKKFTPESKFPENELK